MNTYRLTNEEQKTFDSIVATPYMKQTLHLIHQSVKEYGSSPSGYLRVFDDVYSILYQAKPFVDTYLAKRKKTGEIKDVSQALKSIAGNSFSQALIYIFLLNKQVGTINPNIYITSKKSQVPSFDKIATIFVGDETQKPDCDIIIYSLNPDDVLKKCMILSLKTSLRERAGQTYKWKLLMEIATTDNPLKEKYGISYPTDVMPLVCFATVNFYDEINNPQHRGMFKFFDKSFIAKHIDAEFISRLSELPEFVNNTL